MASNVRFVDSLKVGAYDSSGTGGGGGSGITILNNVYNYLLVHVITFCFMHFIHVTYFSNLLIHASY